MATNKTQERTFGCHHYSKRSRRNLHNQGGKAWRQAGVALSALRVCAALSKNIDCAFLAYKYRRDKIKAANSSEEIAQLVKKYGRDVFNKSLYEPIFKHYTKKQWDKYPSELDASVLLRLPCRTTTDDRYFGDQWQVGSRLIWTIGGENVTEVYDAPALVEAPTTHWLP